MMIDRMRKRKEKKTLEIQKEQEKKTLEIQKEQEKKLLEDFVKSPRLNVLFKKSYLDYVWGSYNRDDRKIYYLDDFIEIIKSHPQLESRDFCIIIRDFSRLKLNHYVDDLLDWVFSNRFDWIFEYNFSETMYKLGDKYIKKAEDCAWEHGNILRYMCVYDFCTDNDKLLKEMIQRIHHKTYYPSEKEISVFYKDDFHEDKIYRIRNRFEHVDQILLEVGSPIQNLNNWIYCHARDLNWLPLEDYLCELKDVDALLKLLEVHKESNPYRIGNIILKYGTVSQISSFVRDYPGILRSEDVVEKLKQTEHGSDLIPSLSKIEEDFEGRKELEERIFQESDPDQLVEYLCSLNVLNRVQGEDYLLETKSQDDIARYFGDYHDLVRQEQKFLDYLTTIHNRNTLQDAFHFLEYKPDRKKGLSYLEAFLRVRNIDGILTIWREIKETGETLYECLIKQGWLDLEDVKDLLLITSNQEHQSLLKRVKGEYQGPVKNLAERVDQMALDEDYVTDVDSEFMSPEEQLWLVNLSLTRENVLPSAVRNIEEVKENLELYLELLKKCDERKYMYYQDAFAGTRTFEIADQAYQYYLKNQEEKDSKIDLGKMLTYTKVK